MPATRCLVPSSVVVSRLQSLLAGWLIATTAATAHAGWLDMVLPKPQNKMQVQVTIDGDNKQIDVDVFLPDKMDRAATKHPAVILLHGVEGANRYQLVHYQTAARLNRAGFAVFYVHYFDSVPYEDLWLFDASKQLDTKAIAARCGEDSHKWRQALVASIDAIASRDDIDRNALAINGYSLGGFLALAATADCCTEKHGPQIKATVVNWGARFADTKLAQNFPPTMFVHGEADAIVPLSDARAVVSILQQLKCDTTLHVITGGSHTAVTPESLSATKDFLRKHLVRTPAELRSRPQPISERLTTLDVAP